MPEILIVLPVYNEEVVLKKTTETILQWARQNIREYQIQLVLADNNSTDQTSEIGQKLSEKYPEVTYFYIAKKGKGNALYQAFSSYEADWYAFMDADLSTDINDFKKLLQGISDGNDVVIGSRHLSNSVVKRSFVRLIVSFSFHLFLKLFFQCNLTDTSCGFKIFSKKCLAKILPLSINRTWFFDNELVILAHYLGYKTKEVPVNWTEFDQKKRKSRLGIFSVSWEYFVNMLKIRWRIWRDFQKIKK